MVEWSFPSDSFILGDEVEDVAVGAFRDGNEGFPIAGDVTLPPEMDLGVIAVMGEVIGFCFVALGANMSMALNFSDLMLSF